MLQFISLLYTIITSHFLHDRPWVFIVWFGVAPYSHRIGTQKITEAFVRSLDFLWLEADVRLGVNVDIFNALSMVICVAIEW
jgi:hypothetical protein